MREYNISSQKSARGIQNLKRHGGGRGEALIFIYAMLSLAVLVVVLVDVLDERHVLFLRKPSEPFDGCFRPGFLGRQVSELDVLVLLCIGLVLNL